MCDKIKYLSAAPMLADAISFIYHENSVSACSCNRHSIIPTTPHPTVRPAPPGGFFVPRKNQRRQHEPPLVQSILIRFS